MTARYRYAATCSKGIEGPLAEELRSFGCENVRETVAAATFAGPLEIGLRTCLWSRLASRILLELAEFPASTADQLYQGVAAVPWGEHLTPEDTLAVDAVGSTSGLIHSGFAALKVKDAVVDRLRESTGRRPSVDLERPDIRLNLRLHHEQATLSLDLSGEPLHRRGYRVTAEQGEAPLKESLAAAILVRAGWPGIAQDGGALFDPMCGSGTLLVEGVLIASDQAPGLLRDHWGFDGWLGHDEEAWRGLIEEAEDRAEAGRTRSPLVIGRDVDPAAVELARACLRRAGFRDCVQIELGDVADLEPPPDASSGLVVTNPPYGLRMKSTEDLEGLYSLLGQRLASTFEGWRAAVFTSEPHLARAIGLRSHKSYTLFNGAVRTKLYLFDLSSGNVWREVRGTARPQ